MARRTPTARRGGGAPRGSDPRIARVAGALSSSPSDLERLRARVFDPLSSNRSPLARRPTVPGRRSDTQLLAFLRARVPPSVGSDSEGEGRVRSPYACAPSSEMSLVANGIACSWYRSRTQGTDAGGPKGQRGGVSRRWRFVTSEDVDADGGNPDLVAPLDCKRSLLVRGSVCTVGDKFDATLRNQNSRGRKHDAFYGPGRTLRARLPVVPALRRRVRDQNNETEADHIHRTAGYTPSCVDGSRAFQCISKNTFQFFSTLAWAHASRVHNDHE